MIKKEVTYTDFNGTKRTEEHFFHLSKPEMMELQLSEEGGMYEKIQRIINSNDNKEIYAIYKQFVLASYGKKTADGKGFVKFDPVDEHKYANEFVQTEAFNELFIQLLANADEFAKFLTGILPADLQEQVSNVTTIEEARAIAAEAMR